MTKIVDIQTQCASSEWNVETKIVDGNGIRRIDISGKNSSRQELPEILLSFSLPTVGILFRWVPEEDRLPTLADKPFDCDQVLYAPLTSLYGACGKNALTISVSDPRCECRILCAPDGFQNRMNIRMELFRPGSGTCGKDFSIAIMLDQRPLLWRECVEDAIRDYEKDYPPMPVPEIAYQPFYSTWYSYLQNVSAEKMEKECRQAAALGMKTMILDDGWQTSGNGDWWHDCGSWELYREKFPNMREHVKKVHELGMKYMVWFGLPFVGKDNPLFMRFQGKFLKRWAVKTVWILDPRYPDVREHLVSMLERYMKEWDVDGFKLDYLESFRKLNADFTRIGGKNGTDDVQSDKVAPGRDSESVEEGVDKLMTAIRTRLSVMKPDLMLEFRQTYIGPAMRQYGNLFRAGDCPCNILANRNRIAQLRLTSGKTAVHSDMITWNPAESVENAAMQLLNVIFSVPQISVKLAEITESHRNMLAFYLNFMSRHTETLYRSRFLAGAPERGYSILSAESDFEQIKAIYEEGTISLIPNKQTVFLINASGANVLHAGFPGEYAGTVYSPEGVVTARLRLSAGISALAVPNAGMIQLDVIK